MEPLVWPGVEITFQGMAPTVDGHRAIPHRLIHRARFADLHVHPILRRLDNRRVHRRGVHLCPGSLPQLSGGADVVVVEVGENDGIQFLALQRGDDGFRLARRSTTMVPCPSEMM